LFWGGAENLKISKLMKVQQEKPVPSKLHIIRANI